MLYENEASERDVGNPVLGEPRQRWLQPALSLFQGSCCCHRMPGPTGESDERFAVLGDEA